MNVFGILAGIVVLLIIGLGFVWVIRGERYFGYLWWPYIMGLGGLLILGSIFIVSDWVALLVGAFGASLVWGSTELKEQAVRAELGWYPFKQDKILPPFAETIRKKKAPHL